MEVEEARFGGAHDGESSQRLGDGADLEEGAAGHAAFGFEIGIAVGGNVGRAVPIDESYCHTRGAGMSYLMGYVAIQVVEDGLLGHSIVSTQRKEG